MLRLPLLLASSLLILAACGDGAAPPPPPSAGAPGEPSLPRFDAELIYADFSARDQAALDKYRNTPFIVTGRLQKIHADNPRELRLDLKAADASHPLEVRLKATGSCAARHAPDCPEQAALDTLPRGFKVYLKCDGASLEQAPPTVTGCVLTGGPGRAD